MDQLRIAVRLGLLFSTLLVVAMIASGLRSGGAAAAGTPAATSQSVQIVQLYVLQGHSMASMSLMGPDGKPHDSIVPSTFVVKRGIPVRLVITNYDSMPHTFTAPELGLNVIIKAGKQHGQMGSMGAGMMDNITPSITTYTFTPTKANVYRWFCALPCDDGAKGWAMSQGYRGPGREGFMAGWVVVWA
jgi:hypothetical protein